MKKKKIKLKKNSILFLMLFVVFCSSIYKISTYFIDLKINKTTNENLTDDVTEIQIDPNGNEIISVDFDKLRNTNKDIKGWILFNNKKVNYPLVQTVDNSYYLNHSFTKEKNTLGTLFIDYRNQSFGDSNVVIFGHNTYDNSMFGSLKDVFNKSFFDNEENKLIEIIDTDNSEHYYEIFSYYTIESEEYYITTSFSNDKELEKFIETIQNRSLKNFNTTISKNDKILTLSTCNGSGETSKRTVIHAKLM